MVKYTAVSNNGNTDSQNESDGIKKSSEEVIDEEGFVNGSLDMEIGTSTIEEHVPEFINKDNEQTDENSKFVLEAHLNSAIQGFEKLLESGIEQILKIFEQKIAYDTTKQQQIDRLHIELQKHRTDLIAKTNRPLVNGLISMHKDVGKLVENFKKKPVEELEPDLFFQAFIDFQDDIEILLDQNGIVTFSELEEKFEPRRQRVVKNIITTDEQLIGTVAERIRPGFEQANDLIQKERVSVYILDKRANQQEDDKTRNRTDNLISSKLGENND